MSAAQRIAIIGAGWAGLACAVELAASGRRVDVYEASRTLGGRARSFDWNGVHIDNGQHILIGAYRECLRLMCKVGVDPDAALLRIPLTLDYPGELRLVAPRLPAPLHMAFALLGARGMDWSDKLAAVRLMARLKRNNYRIEPDITVSQWLATQAISLRQRALIWDALCVSALNTPPERASAQVLANVLRDSLGASREASDMLIPRWSLSQIFPEPAAQFVRARGGQVHTGQRIHSLRHENSLWHLDTREPYDAVVVSVAPYHVADLLGQASPISASLAFEPIVTTYLQYPQELALPRTMTGVAAGMSQWLFDRQELCGQAGLIAAVISAHGRHLELSSAEMERHIDQDVRRFTRNPPPPPCACLTITEKRATFSAVPGAPRPAQRLAQSLWLASDAVAGDYPSTLESAVRSGVQVAHAIA